MLWTLWAALTAKTVRAAPAPVSTAGLPPCGCCVEVKGWLTEAPEARSPPEVNAGRGGRKVVEGRAL